MFRPDCFKIEYVISRKMPYGIEEQTSPSMLARGGSTGMGKTRIIQKFLRDNRTHFDKKLGRTRLPVVSIQMPPSPSERDLYEEILAAMGGIFNRKSMLLGQDLASFGSTYSQVSPRWPILNCAFPFCPQSCAADLVCAYWSSGQI